MFVGGGGEDGSGVVAGGAGIRFTDEEGDWSCGSCVTGVDGWLVESVGVVEVGSVVGVGLVV